MKGNIYKIGGEWDDLNQWKGPVLCTSQWWSLQALRWARGFPHSPKFHDDKETNDNVDGDINDEDADDEKMPR